MALLLKKRPHFARLASNSLFIWRWPSSSCPHLLLKSQAHITRCRLCGAGDHTQDFVNTRQGLYQLRYVPLPQYHMAQEHKAILDLPNTSPGLVKEPIIIFEKNLLKIQIKVRSKDSSEERIKVPTRPDDKNRDFCVRPVVGTGQAHLPLQACLPPCEAGCWDCSAPRIQGRWVLDTQSVPRITPATGIHPSIFMLETGTGLGVTSEAGRPWSLQSLL